MDIYLGNWLRAHRNNRRMTQSEVGVRSGLGQPHVSELEAGMAGDVPPSTLQRYVSALGSTLLMGLVEATPDTAGQLELARPVGAAVYTNRTVHYPRNPALVTRLTCRGPL
jgi:transcriptional regulator with XRE-family HTH domain